MGLFWDLIQHGQIREQAGRADSLEQRVERLERELLETRRLLLDTLERLEKHLNTDLNQDGRVG
jgi:hypothetical protein